MHNRFPRSASLVVCAALWICVAWALACGGGFRPYRKMAQAAGSLLSVPAQARDQELQISLRRALVREGGSSALELTPAVFMERGFVVGSVEDTAQAEAIVARARSVEGLRSVESYLPVKSPEKTKSWASVKASDAETVLAFKAAIPTHPDLVVTRYRVEAVDGQVVLMGVVESLQESARVEEVARTTPGVVGVTNFLRVVEPEYSSLRPRLR